MTLLALSLGAPLTSCQDDAHDAESLDDEPPLDAPMNPAVEARRQLALGGSQLLDPSSTANAPLVTAEDLVAAIDIDPDLVVGASTQGPAQFISAVGGLGVIETLRGSHFAVLSTGVVGTRSEPGTDMAPNGPLGDAVSLEIELDVPERLTKLSFYYNFLSAESPEFIDEGYNDTFTATLVGPDGTEYPVTVASVDCRFGDDDCEEESGNGYADASMQRAAGTGFDILADDPSGVDFMSNLTGQPDAGMTDFQRVDFDLPISGSMTLVFEIHDHGDGILDSAVILDDLRFHAMEMVSLNWRHGDASEPVLVDADGSIVEDTDALLAASHSVRGVAADGATQILLRTRTPGPGTVEYSLQSSTFPQDGSVGALNGPAGGLVTVPTIETALGEHWAFATYVAPSDFVRDAADEDLAERSVELAASFVPEGGGAGGFEDVQAVAIVRPPVVLVDGIWAGANPWQHYLQDDERFTIHRTIYGSTIQLDNHLGVHPDGTIQEALLGQQDGGIAASQVDVIAHGLGGLLTRQMMSQASTSNSRNFFQGPVNKLITLNTPHLGSSFATYAVEMMAVFPTYVGPANASVAAGGGPLSDMQHGSIFLNALPAGSVPSHAIIGNDGPNPVIYSTVTVNTITPAGGWFANIMLKHPDALAEWQPISISQRMNAMMNVMFPGGQEHDILSISESQAGGLPVSATTPVVSSFSPAPANYSGIHYWSPGGRNANTLQNVAYDFNTRLVELLNASTSSATFAPLPAPSTLMPVGPESPVVPESPAPAQSSSTAFSSGFTGLTILAPPEGVLVEPGTEVEVIVDADDDAAVELLWVFHQDGGEFVEYPTFPASVMLPIGEDMIGTVNIQAIGFSSDGDVYGSPDVDLEAIPTASLTAVQLFPRTPYLFGEGDTFSAITIGSYDDGVSRNITSSAVGTVYSTSNPAVFTVSANGLVTAAGVGKATLTARNGNRQDSVTVDVRPDVLAGFEIITDWSQGYCASVRVANNATTPTTDWSVSIDMGDATITEYWNGVFSGTTDNVVIEPEHAWQFAIPGGATKDYTGFCALRGPSMEELPTVVSVTASH